MSCSAGPSHEKDRAITWRWSRLEAIPAKETAMDGEDQPSEQTPHLAPALTAVILGVVMMAAIGAYARSLESRSITALAADEAIFQRFGELLAIKNQGIALQQAAAETDGLLPVYGASEQNLQAPYNRPFHPTNLLRDHATGFTVFPVGKDATTCLIILQKLAGVGPSLQGRKVVVCLSPHWFFNRLTVPADGYAGNFSALHAGELAFNTRLSLPLKKDAARRMLQYPATLADRPLLRFALENLAEGSPLSLACYHAVFPLGMMHNALLRYQDHWSVVCYLWQHPAPTSPVIPLRNDRPLDWPTLHREADALYRAHSNNNELGLDNQKWTRQLQEELHRRRNTRTDEAFLRRIRDSQEWVDLELVLRELTEFGARPLLMGMPIHGGWYDQCGITYAARKSYYQKAREVGARYHMALVDFADHDADRSFSIDNMSHPSPRGLVHYSQALDGFFHGVVPRQPELSASGPVAIRGSEEGQPSGPATRSQR
jgi:D-alanine transfer protein